MKPEIQIIPAQNLADFYHEIEDNPDRFQTKPISKLRAIAHSKNPICNEKDPGLVVAYAEGRCVGYIGLLPILLSVDGIDCKVLAPTTQFVNPEFRGRPPTGDTSLSERLYDTIRGLGFDQLNTGFNRSGEKLHARHPDWFVRCPDMPFLSITLSRVQLTSSMFRRLALLTGSKFIGKASLELFSKLDRSLLPVFGGKLGMTVDGDQAKFEVVEIDKVMAPSRRGFTTDPIYFKRSTEVINWMIAYPWYEAGSPADSNYYFSNPRDRFEYHAYQIYDEKRSNAGYFVVQISRDNLYTTLKILDYDIRSQLTESHILNFAIKVAISNGVNMIGCSYAFRAAIDSNVRLRTLTTEYSRPQFMSIQPDSRLIGRESEIKFNYCDGDRAFV